MRDILGKRFSSGNRLTNLSGYVEEDTLVELKKKKGKDVCSLFITYIRNARKFYMYK